MREVRWREFADAQYQQACRRHPRLKEAVDGALRAIGLAGSEQRVVPGSGNTLRFVETRRAQTTPPTALYFTYDAREDCYWVEEFWVRD